MKTFVIMYKDGSYSVPFQAKNLKEARKLTNYNARKGFGVIEIVY